MARVTNKTKLQTEIVNWWSHWPIIDGNAAWTAKVTKQNKTPKKAKKRLHSLPKKQQNKQVIQVGTDCASLSSQAGHAVKVQSNGFHQKTTEQASDSSVHRLCISNLSSRSSSQSSIQWFPQTNNRKSKRFKWAQIVHLYPLKQSKFNPTVSPKKQQNKQAIQVGTDCASLSSQAVKVQSNGFPKKQQDKQAIQVGTDCASLSSQAGSEVKVQSRSFPNKQQHKQVIQVGTDCASLSSQAGQEVKVTLQSRNNWKLKIWERYERLKLKNVFDHNSVSFDANASILDSA